VYECRALLASWRVATPSFPFCSSPTQARMHAGGVVPRRRRCQREQSSSWGTSASRYRLWVCECCHDAEGAGTVIVHSGFDSCWLLRTMLSGASKSGSCQGWDGGGAAQQQPYDRIHLASCLQSANARACTHAQDTGRHSNWAQPLVADTPAQGTGNVLKRVLVG